MVFNENLKNQTKLRKIKGLVETISSILVMPNYSSDSIKNIDNIKELDIDKCPICNENHIIKYGRRNDRQRYKCKSCGKIFDERTTSAISHTKLPIDKWFKYISLLVHRFSIRECARILDISVRTSFFMRHKIMDCLNLIVKRESIYNGMSIESCYLKGYDENNCVAIYSDSNGNIVTVKSYVARDEILDIEKNINNIDERGVYLTKKIENHYDRFKDWLKKYRGVSIKYFSNYLVLFSWIEKINKKDRFYEIKKLLSKILSINGCITIDMVKNRLVEML